MPTARRYLAPRPLAEGTLTCRVRTTDKGMSMHIDEGNALLLTARQKGRDWIVYSDAAASESCIIAKLRQHKDGTFTCVRERTAAQSTGMWESLVVRGATHSVSESLPELNTLSGALPLEAEQASSASFGADDLWELPPGELESRLRQATESHGRDARNGQPAQLFEIITKLPKWNGERQRRLTPAAPLTPRSPPAAPRLAPQAARIRSSWPSTDARSSRASATCN